MDACFELLNKQSEYIRLTREAPSNDWLPFLNVQAVRFCSLASNSDLADEIDLRNQDVLELLRNMSDARSPSVDLMFVNEKTSKLIKETRTVRIASLQMSSLVLLKVNRTVGIDEHVANATGVCKMPKSCGELSCNLGDFTYYQLGDYIVLPQPRLLAVGEKIEYSLWRSSSEKIRVNRAYFAGPQHRISYRVECAGSKTGAKINVTCGKRGYLNPHPTALPVVCQEKDQDFGERETLWNRRVRRSCAECSKIGTERCEAVDGGFVCHCKEHWTVCSSTKSYERFFPAHALHSASCLLAITENSKY
ncbi:unnamed protein product [Heligmosomoides polygyrus]|uniref:EGF-like domain-containing protein n=1 Tax=Heligmosomoides polygyrus TaxID=6339 RepID=A0A183GE10_HELPZ|nr:unnamed protein product [Heligmosomoides polygyrus]